MTKSGIILATSALISSFAFFSCSEDEVDYNYEKNNAYVNFTLGDTVLSYDTTFDYSDALLVGSNNETYSQNLAKFACALALDCYDTTKVSLKKTSQTNPTNPRDSSDNTTLYKNFGFSDAEYIKLSASDYKSDTRDVTNAVFAHKEVSDEKSYQIFTVAIQGSSGMEQWFSNFDVGAYTEDNTYATLSATHSVAEAVKSGVTDTDSVRAESLSNYATLAAKYPTEHKGFALAAHRLNEKLSEYVSSHEESGAEKIILLTGHSRGGAIANILGKIYEDDENWTSFTYTFATPRTTTNENASSYKTIFNILNSDDLVTELPLKDWKFTRYGTDKSASIGSDYASQWKNKVPFVSDYISAEGQNIAYLSGVAADREDLYKSDDASAKDSNVFRIEYETEDAANVGLSYLQNYGFAVSSYDPYSTISVSQNDDGTYVLSGEFRPQFFLNVLVMSICLASADSDAAKEFVATMCSGFSSLHQKALFTLSQKITGFAYSHSAPCYTILVENISE